MKQHFITAAAALLLAGLMSGCGEKDEPTVKKTIEAFRTYSEMSDGTWTCENHTYKYRLEITGTLPNAACESTYVYLSNLKKISFDEAARAGGISSNSRDYFSPEDAVLVELK